MLFNRNNLAVAKIASKSDVRPELAGVFFTKDKTVATDVYKLVEVTVPDGGDVLTAENYPKVEGKTAMRSFKPFILPAKMVSAIKLPKDKIGGVPHQFTELLAVSHVDDKIVKLLKTDLETANETSIKKIEGTYPDYARVIPTVVPVAEVTVNAEYLIDVLSVLAGIDERQFVTIKFYAEGQPVVMETKNGKNGQRGLGLVMPLRV